MGFLWLSQGNMEQKGEETGAWGPWECLLALSALMEWDL